MLIKSSKMKCVVRVSYMVWLMFVQKILRR